MVDPERDAHLLEIGRAISEWARVQDELYGIVHSILRCTARQASVVFFRTPNIESRLTLTDDLLKTIFPQTSEKPGSKPHPGYVVWTDIQADVREETPFRNKLAHDPVDIFIDMDADVSKPGWMSFATAMSPREALRKPEYPPIKIDAIKTHTERVEAFCERLKDFRFGPLAAQLSIRA